MNRYLLFVPFFLIIGNIFSQQAPGIELNASVNNATIDTCGVDFFDNGGHTLHC